MIFSVGQTLEVTIASLAFGGKGVARHAGGVLFVAGAAPGDRLRARVVTVHKRHAEAVAEEVLAPGPARRDPRCPAADRCGGCQWLHVSADAQAVAKDEALRSSLSRVGKVAVGEFDAIVAAAPSIDFAYRSRAIFRARVTNGVATFGFFAEGSRDLVPLPSTCLVLEPGLDAAVRSLGTRRWPEGPFRVELTADGSGGVHATITLGQPGVTAEGYRAALEGFPHRVVDAEGRLLAESDPSFRIARTVRVGGRELVIRARPGQFTQVHTAQNQRMVERVLELAALSGAEVVLDLFAGAGNLALPLALGARRVVAVERASASVEDGRANARANGIANCEFLADDVGRSLSGKRLPRPDVVVLDPPRSGAAECLAGVAALAPGRIVYVSCNPPTLARDLATLTASGYRVERAGALDMFPQTFHVEAVALLTRTC